MNQAQTEVRSVGSVGDPNRNRYLLRLGQPRPVLERRGRGFRCPEGGVQQPGRSNGHAGGGGRQRHTQLRDDTVALQVQEEAGNVRLGLRAVTKGDSRPAADFQITVQSLDDEQGYTAEAGGDFRSFSQTFFFAPSSFQQESGRYVHTVWQTLTIVDDAVTEKTEWFRLQIGEPSHADVTLAHSEAVVEIQDSDVTTLSLTCLPANEGEPITVRIAPDKPVSFPIAVVARTVPGTAVEGSDYTRYVDSLELFASFQTERTFTITTTEDLLYDGDKTFEVVLD